MPYPKEHELGAMMKNSSRRGPGRSNSSHTMVKVDRRGNPILRGGNSGNSRGNAVGTPDRTEKPQFAKKEIRTSEIGIESKPSIDDQFLDNRVDFQKAPEFSQKMLERAHFNPDTEIGHDIFVSALIADEMEARIKSAPSTSLDSTTVSKLRIEMANLRSRRQVTGVTRWALNDEFVEEKWDPSFSAPLFTNHSKKNSNNAADDDDSVDVETMAGNGVKDVICTRFNTATSVIRLPLLCEHAPTADVMSTLRDSLGLPFTPLRHSLVPTRISMSTTLDFSTSGLQSALIAFDEPFDHPQVQGVLARVAELYHLRLHGGIVIFVGTPRIVHLADDEEEFVSEAPSQPTSSSNPPELGGNSAAITASTTTLTESSQSVEAAAQPLSSIVVSPSQNTSLVEAGGVVDFEPDMSRLPDHTYTFVIRGLPKGGGAVVDRLHYLSDRGFVNYSQRGRHGFHMTKIFRQGKRIMSRDLLPYLGDHLKGLSEEYAPLSEGLKNGLRFVEAEEVGGATAHQISRAWDSLIRTTSVNLAELEKHAKNLQAAGINPSHPQSLKTCLESIKASHCDYTRAVRASIHRHVLIDTLTSLSDVHWNALASIRLRLYGLKVVPGDVVCVDKTSRWDIGGNDSPSDYVPSFQDANIPRWTHKYCELDHTLPPLEGRSGTSGGEYTSGLVKVIESEAEAKMYDITDVLLPKLGRPPTHITTQSVVSPADFMMFPTHKVNHSVFARLHDTFAIGGLSSMKLGPFATYRRLIVKPQDLSFAMFGNSLRETWGHETSAQNGPNSGKATRNWTQPLAAGTIGGRDRDSTGISTYVDRDGIIRIASPYHRALNRGGGNNDGTSDEGENETHQAVARPALKRPRGRSELLGMVITGSACIMRATLPRGTPLTSMIREVFNTRGVTPGQILGLANINTTSVDIARKSQYRVRSGGRNLSNLKLSQK